ncbi:uncharacterized protein C2orf42 homolog isoform X1 [Gadus macrocephalus]|uniref:uncharacterized protein C2orf42 homolog isoform X1 n=1 Tax=Gadus macrocephalus TaxID=80720 RepID=UPI0028CBADB0|nr:uncharacterized protein C2orf42 homolog isoform X1 [Gadus macrocephalus]
MQHMKVQDQQVQMDPELKVTSSPARVHPSSASQPIEPSPAARPRDGRKGGHSTPSTPAFLSNLGKATLRGIRKCPQCGVYNGTRGLSCKNKACGVTLRDGSTGERSGHKKIVLEVVKVVLDAGERDTVSGEETEEEAGGGVQVFSVCQKGRSSAPVQLGFVELVPTDTAIATSEGATLLTRINLGRCFLPSCRQQAQRSNAIPSGQLMGDDGSPGGPDSSDNNNVCVHVKQAMECQSLASPLSLKSTVLEGLPVPVEVRDELWRLATETPGPLVQRVSADRLVVKCHSDPNHPLGLLHLTIGSSTAGRSRDGHVPQQEEAFHCSCQVSARKGKGASSQAQLGSAGGPEPCLHFYACVCALASDEQLASDYHAFINYTPKVIGESRRLTSRSHCAAGKLSLQQHEPISSLHKRKRLRPDDPLALSAVPPAGAGSAGPAPVSQRKPVQRKIQCASGHKSTGSSQVVDENIVAMGFHQWLAGVTERIHQTMHYQSDGRPEPLVYHIPQEFFQALQHRLSLGSKKRRLPNATTAVVRTELPLGSYSKYSWHITSLLQVKQIFDTPELPLELTQSFVRNIDGSYSPFRCPDPPCESEAVAMGYRTDKPQVIRPLELRTFLKVGTWAEDPKEATPFLIEWTPDLLPLSRLGELRIGFEFGHQQSGQSEHGMCEGAGTARAVGTARNKLSAEHAGAHTLEILQVVA